LPSLVSHQGGNLSKQKNEACGNDSSRNIMQYKTLTFSNDTRIDDAPKTCENNVNALRMHQRVMRLININMRYT
jgi:hypothetical protein